MKRIAIYTASIGGYDAVRQPIVIDERFDYILFTDEVKEERVGAWLVRKVDYENEDKTRVARYVKTHPHTLLSNYDATLWLDASIEILTSFVYERCVELLEKGVQLASIQHPWRDCIYDEAYVVYGLEEERKIMDWCHRLRKEGYPRHNGLYESGVLFRKNDVGVVQLNEEWWNVILHHTRRDQLALNYLLWKRDSSVLIRRILWGWMVCLFNIDRLRSSFLSGWYVGMITSIFINKSSFFRYCFTSSSLSTSLTASEASPE